MPSPSPTPQTSRPSICLLPTQQEAFWAGRTGEGSRASRVGPSGPHRASDPDNGGGPERWGARACPALARRPATVPITVHIVPGDWAGWPWRQRLKPHLCSASSQGSMEPPRPQGSRFTALAAGRLVPLRRLQAPTLLCAGLTLGTGSRNRREEGQPGGSVSGTGRQRGDCLSCQPNARPPGSPVAAQVTQALPVAGPMAAFQPAAPLSLLWAQPALRMPLRPSANCGRPLCALHQLSARGCQGAKFLNWDWPLPLPCAAHSRAIPPQATFRGSWAGRRGWS